MLEQLARILQSAAGSLWIAVQLLFFSAVAFGYMALLMNGREAIAAARRAFSEIRLNLSLYFFDILLIAPTVTILVKAIRLGIAHSPLTVVDQNSWSVFGRYGTFIAVIFVGDFVWYWRHRLEHTRLLWPSHAIHHSDTQMNWLTLARFHPVNRLTTASLDIVVLAMLGFPDWALIANEMVRHYYGEVIHADLPWTFGPVSYVLVSPVMHRWHHARDVVGAGSNFATVFSVFDRAFGTYHVPGLCTVPLGVTDDIGPGLWDQLRFPFVEWYRDLKGRRSAEPIDFEPPDGVDASVLRRDNAHQRT